MDLGLVAALWLTMAVQAEQDAACLACHGEKEIRSEAGRSIYVDPAKHKTSVHGSLECRTCHTAVKEYPHPEPTPQVRCASCHTPPPAELSRSVHGVLGAEACASCHGNVHDIEQAGKVPARECSACHTNIVNEYRLSVHGTARKNGNTDGATCRSCHGPAHKILPVRDPASPVAKKNLPDTCGACHANPEFLARHNIPFARPVEAYRLSVHGRALARGNEAAASCSDCHGSHGIFPARDSRSRINHWNVPDTCGACHTAIHNTYVESVHGRAVRRGVPAAPVCTDCHGEHTILAPSEPQSLVNPARVSSVTCGHCHTDERLARRYNLPLDKVPAFQDSYHGLALRSGSQTVANCASCHGVHNILPSSDPRSTIHPANLARTCGSCHPGAGERFAIGLVHVAPATVSEHVVVRWIRMAYWILIPFAVGFMLLHNAIDFFAKLIRGGPHVRSGEEVMRMNLHFRIAHGLVVPSFTVLVITGFALKFPEAWWASPILRWESQFAFRGTVHRIAAVVLISSLVYHVVHLIASHRDRIILRHLRPGIEDLTDLLSLLRYNLGLTDDRPRFGKFSYAEKLEYLAFVWGSLVMTVSGFLLWFNNFTLRNFPKWVADAATAIHYYEAILAALSILLWHFYMVVFDPDVYPMDRAWLTGRTSADHLRETRPAYYLQLLREQQTKPAAPDEAPEAQAGEVAHVETAGEDKTEEKSPQRDARPPTSDDPAK